MAPQIIKNFCPKRILLYFILLIRHAFPACLMHLGRIKSKNPSIIKRSILYSFFPDFHKTSVCILP